MSMFLRLSFLVGFGAGALSAQASSSSSSVPAMGSYSPAVWDADGFFEELKSPASDYQMGGEWGKYVVTPQMLDSASAAFKRGAYAAAKVSSATGFYLGTFAGYQIVATNHHVLPRANRCTSAYFPLLNKSFKCDKFFGTWTDVDLALFSIRVNSEADVAALNAVGKNFDFDAELSPGRELLTIGFGVGNNPGQKMVANQDTDCVVYSGANDFRFMADPDDLNPGPYKAWSFANGCDVSHGDSGSAMLDRSTGNVLGIIWTGRIPKNSKVQTSEYMRNLLANPTEEIWEELSYGVPAVKIKAHFEKLIADASTAEETRTVLKALLGQ